MNIQIKATNLELTEDIRNYIDKRFEVLQRFIDEDPSIEIRVEVARITEHHKQGNICRAELHITGKGMDEYASSEKIDIFQAIDDVRDEMQRKLSTGKAKKLSVLRRSGARVKAIIKGFWSK